ncbi:DUF1054 domain-containing protein [Bacillus sp. DTU_2020_1000418_1_SI_GHA_SEK_038]|uniref:YktB family protein n=1 Tax=Bacillus sp. DTU_2020_1000418_1_SI_GHA_SEK_038 TaxID=3077585 RepID=UPI0028E8E2E6|nr:DUF1054 domain-containing protein [Bacillus sp. DTU_2020_1000418_1_SI_GHA_SEK_038]WNS77023.1 DUF1054 domain-containing protein [Bacillus sp. DTU_2020_1000418_1_SI_GHA_SEK_038]
MSFSGFTNTDFDVFKIEGLEERMEALITSIRPKLEELGKYFAPMLTIETGDEIYPHVAKHARRTVNPPKDTWVAYASNPRGYKMLPHFQIGLWETHVFIWFALIYEAPNKDDFGKKLEMNLNKIYKHIPNHFVWSTDHTKPMANVHGELAKEDLQSMFIRLQKVKKAEILCGVHIPSKEAIEMDPQAFLEHAESVFKTLLPLYKMF